MTEQVTGSVLLQVPSVELPPPAATAPRTPPLALRALVSVLLLVGLFVVAFGVVIALILLIGLFSKYARVPIALVILTFVVIAAIGRGLLVLVRKPAEPADEVEVPASEEPELHERLRNLARVVGTRPPDRIVVTADVNAYVREFGPLMGLVRGKRTLAIGTPLLDVLTVAQLEAVLAHELGHLAGGDTRLGPLAFRTDAVIMHMIEALEDTTVAGVFVTYGKFQHRVSASVRRAQELVADRAAVRTAGRQAAADALHRIRITAHAERLYYQAYLIPLLESGCRPDDLAEGLRELLRDPHRTAELVSAASSAGQPKDPWASHPPTPERIQRIAALADPPGIDVDNRPARAVWRDADRWSRAAHELWLAGAAGVGARFQTVAWDSYGEQTIVPARRSRAAVVDEALGRLGLPPGVDGLRQALTGGRGGALAGELIAAGWRAPGADERDTLLLVATVATATRAALDAGGQFRFSWSGPLALTDRTGREIDVDGLVDEALAGDWEPLNAALAAAAASQPAERAAPGEIVAAASTATVPEPAAPSAPSASAAPVAPSAPRAPSAPAEPSGQSSVGQPPSPPFQRASGDWLWEARVGRFVNRARVKVGRDALSFGKNVFAFDDVETVSMKFGTEGWVGAVIRVHLRSGRWVKMKAVSGSRKGKPAVAVTFDYLWWLLERRVGPSLRSQIVAAIEAGGEAQVGGLTLSKRGVSGKATGGQEVPWAELVDAVVDGAIVRLRRVSGKPIKLKHGADNVFLLEDLIPELRARFG
jgi:Zn-dependent protease with chaperone function